jgi:hypothetical protein
MKYSELINFEPIESVIQLREADDFSEARRLVETFVISDRMAELLIGQVFQQLQFDKPADSKGVIIVGNYGTGKSHLMALISAIAEHADLADAVNDATVKDSASSIAGRFQVLRAEIGSTTMTLRDIVCASIEEKLGELGVDYQFPMAGDVTNNKDSFIAMMADFEKVHPQQGLLLVLDELLDYLRSRDEHALILDLSFLREVGEVCKSTRFRFISGVQESLFDNPRFQFVAKSLHRVKARFKQVRIARDDVAYVVSHRLLKKTPEQAGRVREHLSQFAPLYGSMNEKMDKFVELFPVHPAYLDTFEKVYVAEKREVLKTLSAAIREVIDQTVPDDAPGLIAYDSYWARLQNDPSFRSEPDIKEVVDKSKVLEDRIQHGFTQPKYKDVAIRIIHALSVHRLTTDDIHAPLGATPEELRDDLCLILPTPEKDAAFLKTLVEKTLQEILRTVSGQFITANKENNQYYLDLKKDVDFDSLIARKADTLSLDQLDRHYFTALTRVMEAADITHVAGYKIWEHELEWRERKAERGGYLFFGAPNERSTAQPPRDFYLYFLQPHEAPNYKDEKKPDEVFFKLKQRDDEFDTALKLYAGACEQAATASGENKRIYEQKATQNLSTLTQWLREHMTTAFEVTYEGRTKTLQEVIQGKVPGGLPNASVRDLVNIAGSICLAPQFENKSPDYPVFSVLVTQRNREQAAGEALKWIAGGVKSKQGTAILDALLLLDGDQLQPRQSRYATQVLDLLAKKKKGQVLNRADLVQDEVGIDYWTHFRLEPEFLAVVLAALVHCGALVVSIPGKKLGAGAVEQFASIRVGDLANFKHVEQPKGIQLEPLKELFGMLGLAQGKVVNESTRDQAVQDLQVEVAARVGRLVTSQARMQEGLTFWGRPILSEQESAEWSAKLNGAKDFLESLQAFNTAGKLNNFPHDVDAVKARRAGIELVSEVDELVELIGQVGPQADYLSIAAAVLPADHAWRDEVEQARTDLFAKVSSPSHRAESRFQRTLAQKLAELKTAYQTAYLELHKRAHLGAKDDSKKAALTNDMRLKQLQKLDAVEIMPHQQLQSFQDTLHGLKTCFALSSKDLDQNPVCPHTQYRPVESPPGAMSASQTLVGLDESLDNLVRDWTKTLLDNLEDPTVGDNIKLISDPAGKGELEALMKERELPDPISASFVKALQEALTGLEKVAVTDADLRNALTEGGIPCTIEELKNRFDAYIASLTKGKDAKKTRVVVE